MEYYFKREYIILRYDSLFWLDYKEYVYVFDDKLENFLIW